MTAAAIAAPHPAAVDAAESAWREGGNAIDMAIAAATALVVVYPHQCALGGDLVALVRSPDGRVEAVVAAGPAPAAIDVDALRAHGERMPPIGPQTVTVPGVLAGWAVLAAGAASGLAAHLRRAADLAAAGAQVSAGLARAIRARVEVVHADPGLRALLLDAAVPLPEGAPLLQPRLAETLRAIADGGPEAFYGGEVGERLAAGVRRLGGTLTGEDLATYRAESCAPISGEAFGARWHATPPPTQGATLLGLLRALGEGQPPLAAARSLGAARDALLGDPRRGAIDIEALMAGAVPVAAPGPMRAAGDTVAIAAADEEGRVVTLIQSVYQTFGAGILEPDTGIVLHNRGSAFSLVPGHPAELAPGGRPPHTLCPAIAETPGGAIVAAGCQGGRAQPQVIAQIAPAIAADASDLEAVLARPRWVVGARDMNRERETVIAEPHAAAPEGEAAAAGVPLEQLAERTDLAGHVQLARLSCGAVDAASDPRADGRASVLRA